MFNSNSLETPYKYAYFSPEITTCLQATSQKEGKKERKRSDSSPLCRRYSPLEVDVDRVGMNRWRVVIRLASKPAASSPSCPGAVHRCRARPGMAQHCRSTQAAVAGGGPGKLHFSGAVILPV